MFFIIFVGLHNRIWLMFVVAKKVDWCVYDRPIIVMVFAVFYPVRNIAEQVLVARDDATLETLVVNYRRLPGILPGNYALDYPVQGVISKLPGILGDEGGVNYPSA
jgi:hypothetical protein